MSVERRKHRTSIFFKIVVIILVVGFSFIFYRMMTMDSELQFVSEYNLPDLPELAIPDFGMEERAVAVNGRAVEQDTLDGTSTNEEPRPIASTAKIITALMVMEKKPFSLGEKGEEIVISQADYDIYSWYLQNNGSVTEIELGEKISEYDAIASMLLASSNNMADITAIWAFSSMDDYLTYANAKLAEWGFKNTIVRVDASGYNTGTVSTANEMAILGEKVLKNPVLREIVGMKKYSVPLAGEIINTNKILGEQGIIGVKTGYNGSYSGYCLISAYEQDDNIVSLALLGATTRQESFNNSLEIVSYLQENFKDTKIVSEGEEVGYYDAWWLEKQPIRAKTDFNVLGYREASNRADVLAETGDLVVDINGTKYNISTSVDGFSKKPNLLQRFLHVFGWGI